ncbi:MAG: LLM class flavin-dependent oxidoreductase [Ilumatobacteraceae bacterium]
MTAVERTVRLGLYCDLRNRPDSGRDAATHYGRWLERIEEAERLGCPSVWLSEHHFFDDAYLPQCWTMAAAIAARTARVLIGTAVALLPLHAAVETAEQVAIADVLSGGRLQPGFGVGYRRPEYEAFEGDYKRRYGVFRERIDELRVRWGEHAGDVRPVTPLPVQRPMPMWAGFNGPQGARLAGRLGLGLQSLNPDLLDTYRDGLAEGGHDAATAKMSGHVELYVTDDPERAWATIAPHVAYRWESYNRHLFEGTRLETDPPQHFDLDAVRANFLIGTAEEVAAGIRSRVAGLPVTDLFCWADFPGLSDEQVDSHVQRVSSELSPLLATSPAASVSP